MPVDLETLPMMLKFGVISDKEFHNIGYIPMVLHFSGLNAVMFS